MTIKKEIYKKNMDPKMLRKIEKNILNGKNYESEYSNTIADADVTNYSNREYVSKKQSVDNCKKSFKHGYNDIYKEFRTNASNDIDYIKKNYIKIKQINKEMGNQKKTYFRNVEDNERNINIIENNSINQESFNTKKKYKEDSQKTFAQILNDPFSDNNYPNTTDNMRINAYPLENRNFYSKEKNNIKNTHNLSFNFIKTTPIEKSTHNPKDIANRFIEITQNCKITKTIKTIEDQINQQKNNKRENELNYDLLVPKKEEEKKNIFEILDPSRYVVISNTPVMDPKSIYCAEIDNEETVYEKPQLSYAQLITQALKSSPDNKLTLSQIYTYIKDTYPYYMNTDPVWQNSIRHNLSLNRNFKKIPRPPNSPGKGGYWALSMENEAI